MLSPGREAVMSDMLGNNTVRGRQPHPSEVAPKLPLYPALIRIQQFKVQTVCPKESRNPDMDTHVAGGNWVTHQSQGVRGSQQLFSLLRARVKVTRLCVGI